MTEVTRMGCGPRGAYRLIVDGVDLGRVRKSVGGYEAANKVHLTKIIAERYLINRQKIVNENQGSR